MLPDFATPLSFLSNYFLYGLGGDIAESHETFEFLRGTWGVIARTPWGYELAHMYFCLRHALSTQSTLRLLLNADMTYEGSIILGSKFSISFNGNEPIEAKDRETLVKDYAQASPHDTTLVKIFSKILYEDEMTRGSDLQIVNNYHDVRHCIARKGMTEEGRVYAKKHAHLLKFADTKPYLTFTAENISAVLEAIFDEQKSEQEFPMYPSMIIETSRRARLWSAFGPTAPSFRVIGGKVMSLEGAFEVREKEKGKDAITKSVKKLGYIIKPLDKSLQDLEETISSKNVINPHGSNVVARVSAQSLIRTLEGDSCTKVLGALRRVSGVTIMDEEGTAKGKRRNDANGDAEKANKRGRFMDF